ncbi:DUF3107 domain-containing protein [Mycobacterium koreense]|uniref:ATP-binding protein n=1 Tax=Mycolicibacillus koreensis TaxID=1069220 RepID=A0A7I7SDB3_9MYCO|nr:DUF3107 domain-containing protein [Mycolicibacillus koreensis]MCV7249932.1 DUF3107 domain-containing protein [Mycolicibacillus koreensis]ODR05777.1 ATP-binding protein [Mycolicibacillus koreensis]OSC34850.1 ATP-binding protein [Mycolicibacillus koreensis]BBY54713.1 hypothetical protein MKOR_19640 [Mycolicibacillus koreensis]
MEVKIGITDSPRELVFTSAQTPEEIEGLVTAALADGSALLPFTDEKGRKFLVVTAKVAYVEVGAADTPRVGFGIAAIGASGAKSGKK